MKHPVKHILLLLLLGLQSGFAKDASPIAEYRLDEQHRVHDPGIPQPRDDHQLSRPDLGD